MSRNEFPQFIFSQIQYLLQNSPNLYSVERAWSGSQYNIGNLDRFTLLIPYCLDFLRWDIVYNAEFPISPPDVIFGPNDDSFLQFLLQTQSSSRSWNFKDQSYLMILVEELRKSYLEYQKKRIEGVDDDRLKFEISTIFSREGIEMMLVNSVADKSKEVRFAVPLTLNINKMLPECPWDHQQKIHLLVIYPVGKKFSSAPRLKLLSSPELKPLISIEDIKIPSWLDGMCLAEYLPNLEELLEKQVSDAVQSIDTRRRFIESLVPYFGRPVEADPLFCRKSCFLAASGVFTFLVHFYISTQFPKQQPSMILQSTQHCNSAGIPIKSSLITEYPWSPRWDVAQMAERIADFVADECLMFKRQC